MPAIWGVISRKGEKITHLGSSMDETMSKYKIDRIDHIDRELAYFSCGHQYITKESHFDKSPIFDEEKKVLFTADIFLSNRPFLIDKLADYFQNHSSKSNYELMGDAEIAFTLFKTFGAAFINMLRGSFAIAIYYTEKDELKLYTDPLSRRYLTYSINEDNVCFGSIYEPLKKCLNRKATLNEKTVALMYSDLQTMSFKVPYLTIYNEFYQLDCGECLTINIKDGTTAHNKYYTVGQGIKTLKLKSDEEYKNIFLSKYRECVKMLLRSDGETGIMLSGGLDSSSVAAIAAEELLEKDKKLYGYTMIPASDFPYSNNPWYIENEQFTVEAQKEKHPNLVTNFINGDDGCAFTRLSEYEKIFETPVKPWMNIDNLFRMNSAAASDNCKILLAGAHGNSTVSYGNMFLYFSQKMLRFKWFKAYSEMKKFCKLNDRSRKGFIKELIKEELLFLKPISSVGENCLLHDDYIKQYGLLKVRNKWLKRMGTEYYQSKRDRYNYMVDPPFFWHIGFYETYMGLKTGVFSIDPTLTVELIELCMSLPIDVFVRNGRERRTIRDYMNDTLPDCVTNEKYGRGIQAADCEFRVKRDWQEIKEIIYTGIKEPELKAYFKAELLDDLIRKIDEANGHWDRKLLIKAGGVCSFGLFLKAYKS